MFRSTQNTWKALWLHKKFKALRLLHIVFWKPQRFYHLADSACSAQVLPMYGAHLKDNKANAN